VAIASAATVDVAAADAESVQITGSTTIASLGNGYPGCYRELRFAGAVTLTHSATLNLGGANITTQAGDVLGFRNLSVGNWVLVSGTRGNDTSKAPLASPAFTGTATYGGFELGYRDMPLTVQNGNYTYAAADRAKGRMKTDGGAYAYTVPAGVFGAGQWVGAINASAAGNITLAQGAGFTLQLAGTALTGNRTLAPGALCTILFTSLTSAFAFGPGVS
jgi:hypothetical protein